MATTTRRKPLANPLDEVRRELLDAAERMELTEQGWVEKLTTAGHGNVQTHLTLRLVASGADPEANYAGAPDLAIEILSGDPHTAAGRAARERDLVEKRRAYAARGAPNYWIVEPRTRRRRPASCTRLKGWGTPGILARQGIARRRAASQAMRRHRRVVPGGC